MTPTVADYIVARLYEESQAPAFLVVGGYAMHLNDAMQRHPRHGFVPCLHEQSAAMAADGFAKQSGRLGVAYLTAGPGAINALNGVAGAHLDSTACLFIVGQLKREHLVRGGPRQFGFQGFDTLSIAKTMTKYATVITDVSQVKPELERCIAIATAHRRGAVWLEIPVDVQALPFNPDEWEDAHLSMPVLAPPDPRAVKKVATRLRESQRPCLLVGRGVRLAGAEGLLTDFLDRRGIPVVTSRNGTDLVDSSHPCFIGRPGIYGSRPANSAVESCDFFLSVGCRLEVLLVSYDFTKFAPRAHKVVVDCDPAELDKPSIAPAVRFVCDAGAFLRALDAELGDFRFAGGAWLDRIASWKTRYPVVLPEYANETRGINTYYFFQLLGRHASANSTFVVDACHAYYTFPQSFDIRRGQRYLSTGGLGTMGYFPAAIGASLADPSRPVYIITGDGSLQMNVQELVTIQRERLPAKVIVLSNNGYLLIKLTQKNLLEGRQIGSDPESGLGLPNLEKVAAAAELPYFRIDKSERADEDVRALVERPGPFLVELVCPADQAIAPRLRSLPQADGSFVSPCYDNMFPYLPDAEYQSNRQK